MVCPTTGEVCYYRTHFEKIRSLALVELALSSQGTDEQLNGKIVEIFENAVEKPEEHPCDERYCSALSSAVAGTMLIQAFIENNAQQEQAKQKDN